ncbi:unnamed protein product [Dibothriocephalus latus]|uniref:Uncharacterized protein n=1 Tax=Dibothriocephalus latus TaxID=60516 RepID=A0A3P7LHY1_DIBLA|nr:unnamed protein product [Dibothriocephalus latus]
MLPLKENRLPQSTNKADNAEKIPKRRRKPAFEGRIETAVFEATDDGVVDIKTSVEQLQPDAEEVAGEKRSHWDDLLSHTISVDGERIPGKLLHQCSIEVSRRLKFS